MADGYVPKPNSGTLSRIPAEKRTSEKFPEFDGEFLMVCPHCQQEQRGWISAWVKTATKTGRQFFSIAFKHREKQPDRTTGMEREQPAKPQQTARPRYGEDDGIPF
jgi:hypothetical protein